MRRKIALLAIALLLAAPLAATSISHVYGITSNSSSAWVPLEGGVYVFEIYNPDAPNADGSCPNNTTADDWDTASATVEYSPDDGITATTIGVAALDTVTSDAKATVQVARGYSFRITVSSVGASTCINFKMAMSQ